MGSLKFRGRLMSLKMANSPQNSQDPQTKRNSGIFYFFASRFFLGEPALWRLMGMLKSLRHWIILANILLAIATALGLVGVVSMVPLFQVTLSKTQNTPGCGASLR